MTDKQFAEIITRLGIIERHLVKQQRMEKEKEVWLDAFTFKEATGRNGEGLRRLRTKLPQLVKPRAENIRGYLYNYTAYMKIFPQPTIIKQSEG